MRDVAWSMGRVGAASVAIALLWANLAQAKVFTDSLMGQGRACGGPLYVRTKTIEWETQFSSCYSRYTILKKTFADKPADYDYILYKLNRPNWNCRYPYIGLYYFDYDDGPGYADHWVVAGIPTFGEYKRFPYRDVVSGKNMIFDEVLSCSLPFFSDGDETNISY